MASARSSPRRSGGLLNLRGRIDIADRAGKVLAIVPFREAVELALDEESK
jgi:hypothetical protein